MPYINMAYYCSQFEGKETFEDFNRLAQIASDVIDSIVSVPVDTEDEHSFPLVQKAVAYEMELLLAQGGAEAITQTGVVSESLGSYSVSMGGSSRNTPSAGGIPVSPLSVSLLRKAGLMNRWAYAERYKRNGYL